MNSTKKLHFVIHLVLVASLCVSLPAQSRTFFVEKDGTGDFKIIQNAVNAASSGDTIRIGPGRFNDQTWVTSPGWSDSVRVLVTQQELTLIGSGYPETVIGPPDPWDPSQGFHKGIVGGDLLGNLILRVQGIWFVNMRDAIYTSYEFEDGSVLNVSHCTFSWNNISLFLLGTNGTASVSHCNFGGMNDSGGYIAAFGQVGLSVSECVFWMSHTTYGQTAISLTRVNNADIFDCEIYEGTSAISSSQGSPLVIQNCLFDGQSNTAVYPGDGANISLEDCIFKNQRRVVRSFSPFNQFSMINCVVENTSECSFDILDMGSLTVTNCDLAKGELGTVFVQDNFGCLHSGTLDMTNNYWGTDNPDSIRAWIHDTEDSDQACYTVNFEPYLSNSTPTEKKSLGGFRSMFR
jgi:hypothetical protein|nr:right-handed parallel beta-helix repeat-containing protein [Candidatus Krumholzibacteria bacterium]